tara:strand:+ start:5377 stop:5976 length:600 start_codon:yes stop_codon:yes gene_type:complete
MIEITIAFLTGVLGPVLLLYIKHILNKKKKTDIVAEALEMGEVVSNKIEDIKNGIKADRVWVTQFHNGGHFYPTGKSITKFSVIYESVNLGVDSIQSNFQNIPVNLFSKSLNELAKNDLIEIPDYKDVEVATYGLRYAAEETGCKSGYLFAIKSIEGKFIGVLGLDYTKKKVKLDHDTTNGVMVDVSSIGGVLMNHLQD